MRAWLLLAVLSWPCHAVSFSDAISNTLGGIWMQRPTWPANQFLMYAKGDAVSVRKPPLLGPFEAGTHIIYWPRHDVCTRETSMHYSCRPYSFPQADVLATDWEPLP